ncbi:MAG: hypothetical protein KKH94_08350 [Candidatus Omnitrophica bacterium]|nr:hypothetical protein [Candidatus Omnitrophota bacterium]
MHDTLIGYASRIKTKIISVCIIFTFLFTSFMPSDRAYCAASMPLLIPNAIEISKHSGAIQEMFISQNTGFPFIIHIQDAHANYEAQKNITHILTTLHQQYGIDTIYTEGFHGDVNVSLLRAFPFTDVKKRLVDRYVTEGKISGVEEYAICSKDPVSLIGVDHEERYVENVKTYVDVARISDEATSFFNQLDEVLSTTAEKIFSPQLLTFVQMKKDFLAHGSDPIEYTRYLLEATRTLTIPITSFKHFSKLADIERFQKKIKTKEIQQETESIINDTLIGLLSDADTERLAFAELDFQGGRMEAYDYYLFLRELSLKYVVDFRTFVNINLYLNYLSLLNDIDGLKLMKDRETIEKKILKKLCTTNDEKRLCQLMGHAKVLKSLFALKAIPEDLHYFREHEKEFTNKTFQTFLNAHSLPLNSFSIEKHMPIVKKFYRLAEAREGSFVKNTLKDMKKSKREVSVLITGGYHTAGLTNRLKRKDISYLVISPQLSELPKENLYDKIMRSYDKYFGVHEGTRGGTVKPMLVIEQLSTGENRPEFEQFITQVMTDFSQQFIKVAKDIMAGKMTLHDLKEMLAVTQYEFIKKLEESNVVDTRVTTGMGGKISQAVLFDLFAKVYNGFVRGYTITTNPTTGDTLRAISNLRVINTVEKADDVRKIDFSDYGIISEETIQQMLTKEEIAKSLMERNTAGKSNYPPDIIREDPKLFKQVRALHIPIYSKQDRTVYVWDAFDVQEALTGLYAAGVNDEAMESIITIGEDGRPRMRTTEGGYVFDINFRKDRQQQWVNAIVNPDFDAFNVSSQARAIKITGTTHYVPSLAVENVILPDISVNNGLIEVLNENRIAIHYVFDAEKGKFIPAFRGGRTEAYDYEDLEFGSVSMPVRMTAEDVEKFSPSVVALLDAETYIGWFYGNVPEGLKQIPNKEYHACPGLSMFTMAHANVEKIKKAVPGTFGLTNLDGPDLIGHVAIKKLKETTKMFVEKTDGTFDIKEGNGWDSVLEALSIADQSIAMLLQAVEEKHGVAIIVGDHGSVDDMTQPGHSFNDVPVFIIDYQNRNLRLVRARGEHNTQADVAVTILHVLGIEKPKEMTGQSLLPADYKGSRDRIVWQVILDGFGHTDFDDANNAFGVAMKKGMIPTIQKLYREANEKENEIILKASGQHAGLRGGLIEDLRAKSELGGRQYKIESRFEMVRLVEGKEQHYPKIKISLYDYANIPEANKTYDYADGLVELRRSPFLHDKKFIVNFMPVHYMTENVEEGTIEVICLDSSQMGSTEYNTWTLGAGRIVQQSIIAIDELWLSGKMQKNRAIENYILQAKEQGFAHLVGIFQEAGVHASARHMYYLIQHLKANGIERFVFDLASDGRDEDGQYCYQRMFQFRGAMDYFGITDYAVNLRGREICFDRAKNWDVTEAWINELVWGSRINREESFSVEPTSEEDPPVLADVIVEHMHNHPIISKPLLTELYETVKKNQDFKKYITIQKEEQGYIDQHSYNLLIKKLFEDGTIQFSQKVEEVVDTIKANQDMMNFLHTAWLANVEFFRIYVEKNSDTTVNVRLYHDDAEEDAEDPSPKNEQEIVMAMRLSLTERNEIIVDGIRRYNLGSKRWLTTEDIGIGKQVYRLLADTLPTGGAIVFPVLDDTVTLRQLIEFMREEWSDHEDNAQLRWRIENCLKGHRIFSDNELRSTRLGTLLVDAGCTYLELLLEGEEGKERLVFRGRKQKDLRMKAPSVSDREGKDIKSPVEQTGMLRPVTPSDTEAMNKAFQIMHAVVQVAQHDPALDENISITIEGLVSTVTIKDTKSVIVCRPFGSPGRAVTINGTTVLFCPDRDNQKNIPIAENIFLNDDTEVVTLRLAPDTVLIFSRKFKPYLHLRPVIYQEDVSFTHYDISAVPGEREDLEKWAVLLYSCVPDIPEDDIKMLRKAHVLHVDAGFDQAQSHLLKFIMEAPTVFIDQLVNRMNTVTLMDKRVISAYLYKKTIPGQPTDNEVIPIIANGTASDFSLADNNVRELRIEFEKDDGVRIFEHNSYIRIIMDGPAAPSWQIIVATYTNKEYEKVMEVLTELAGIETIESSDTAAMAGGAATVTEDPKSIIESEVRSTLTNIIAASGIAIPRTSVEQSVVVLVDAIVKEGYPVSAGGVPDGAYIQHYVRERISITTDPDKVMAGMSSEQNDFINGLFYVAELFTAAAVAVKNVHIADTVRAAQEKILQLTSEQIRDVNNTLKVLTPDRRNEVLGEIKEVLRKRSREVPYAGVINVIQKLIIYPLQRSLMADADQFTEEAPSLSEYVIQPVVLTFLCEKCVRESNPVPYERLEYVARIIAGSISEDECRAFQSTEDRGLFLAQQTHSIITTNPDIAALLAQPDTSEDEHRDDLPGPLQEFIEKHIVPLQPIPGFTSTISPEAVDEHFRSHGLDPEKYSAIVARETEIDDPQVYLYALPITIMAQVSTHLLANCIAQIVLKEIKHLRSFGDTAPLPKIMVEIGTANDTIEVSKVLMDAIRKKINFIPTISGTDPRQSEEAIMAYYVKYQIDPNHFLILLSRYRDEKNPYGYVCVLPREIVDNMSSIHLISAIDIIVREHLIRDKDKTDLPFDSDFMARWQCQHTLYNQTTGVFTLKSSQRIPDKKGLIEPEFLYQDGSTPIVKDIQLRTKALEDIALDTERRAMIDQIKVDLDLYDNIIIRAITADHEARENRIYGVSHHIPKKKGMDLYVIALREEIFQQGTREQITAALRHEVGHAGGEAHDAIREDEKFDAELRALIRQLSDEDKLFTFVGTLVNSLYYLITDEYLDIHSRTTSSEVLRNRYDHNFSSDALTDDPHFMFCEEWVNDILTNNLLPLPPLSKKLFVAEVERFLQNRERSSMHRTEGTIAQIAHAIRTADFINHGVLSIVNATSSLLTQLKNHVREEENIKRLLMGRIVESVQKTLPKRSKQQTLSTVRDTTMARFVTIVVDALFRYAEYHTATHTALGWANKKQSASDDKILARYSYSNNRLVHMCDYNLLPLSLHGKQVVLKKIKEQLAYVERKGTSANIKRLRKTMRKYFIEPLEHEITKEKEFQTRVAERKQKNKEKDTTVTVLDKDPKGAIRSKKKKDGQGDEAYQQYQAQIKQKQFGDTVITKEAAAEKFVEMFGTIGKDLAQYLYNDIIQRFGLIRLSPTIRFIDTAPVMTDEDYFIGEGSAQWPATDRQDIVWLDELVYAKDVLLFLQEISFDRSLKLMHEYLFHELLCAIHGHSKEGLQQSIALQRTEFPQNYMWDDRIARYFKKRFGLDATPDDVAEKGWFRYAIRAFINQKIAKQMSESYPIRLREVLLAGLIKDSGDPEMWNDTRALAQVLIKKALEAQTIDKENAASIQQMLIDILSKGAVFHKKSDENAARAERESSNTAALMHAEYVDMMVKMDREKVREFVERNMFDCYKKIFIFFPADVPPETRAFYCKELRRMLGREEEDIVQTVISSDKLYHVNEGNYQFFEDTLLNFKKINVFIPNQRKIIDIFSASIRQTLRNITDITLHNKVRVIYGDVSSSLPLGYVFTKIENLYAPNSTVENIKLSDEAKLKLGLFFLDAQKVQELEQQRFFNTDDIQDAMTDKLKQAMLQDIIKVFA